MSCIRPTVAAVATSSKVTIHHLKVSPVRISATKLLKHCISFSYSMRVMRAVPVTFSFLPLQTQTALEAPVRFRPHVDSTTATNKYFLIKPLTLTCCYEQLQIFNCGPYVQDVLILKKTQISLLNQQVLITITAGSLCAN